jgi:hypothetical protein
MAYLA